MVDSTIEEEHTTSKETKIGTLAKKRQEQDAYLNNLMFLTNSQLDVKSLRESIKKNNISIDIDKQTGASNDNIDGKGKFYGVDGTYIEGVWSNNKMVETIDS